MKEVTVIQLSEQTGLTRSQIYYLNKEHNLIISEGKINLEDALKIITALKIKKTKVTNDEHFRHILNMLHLQNIALQKQLDLANEREKNYLAELTSYRQHLLSKSTLDTPKNESDIQAKPENNLTARNEDSQKLMQSECANQVTLESCQSINRETNPINEVESHSSSTESIYNAMTSPESESVDTGWIKQKKEMTEQNPDALIATHLPNPDKIEQLLDLKGNRKSTAQVATRKRKNN
ncbi:hypothetical protein [Acinetobacter gyllenbergii]|uniref:hypothetical protein n=1 Tax=Acinetobacter gyllenbergii TaxID=134534 RepID=UPI0021D0DC12|nr:hypothetical protein [Acinetobacter gyllenbergii]